MSGVLAGLQPGDEILIPAFTFVTSANAFVLLGARPVFVDVCPETLNLDHRRLAEALTPKTRAILPVHYAGVACAMDEILCFAREHQLVVIEDNAHGLTGRYKGKPLGSLGDLATLSFHETKNFQCGEGGALLVNREDWVDRAQIVQEKGTNRSKFLRGQVDKYTWVDKGSSYLLGELPAGLLLACLQDATAIQRRRLEIWQRYHRELKDWADRNGVRQPHIPACAEHPGHLYYLIFPQEDCQRAFIQHMGERGILAIFHYQPLHLSPMGLQLGGQAGQCPVTESIAGRLARLPLFPDLQERQQQRVVEAVLEFCC